ncbi:unnamed protein product, partial [Porites evermanni]
DTSVESSDSDDSSNDCLTYVEESFEVMFVPEEEIQQVIIAQSLKGIRTHDLCGSALALYQLRYEDQCTDGIGAGTAKDNRWTNSPIALMAGEAESCSSLW